MVSVPERADAADPEDERDGGDTEKFHGGIEEREGQDGVFVSQHVVAVALDEFLAGALLAVEDLHDAHAGDVFLQEGVDAGDGGADAAVGVANELAKYVSDQQDQRQGAKGGQGELPI